MNVYVLHTPGDSLHTKMWLTTEIPYVTFEFQACTDLKVALATNPHVTSDNVYEITVGGWANTKSVIRRGLFGSEVASGMTPDVLSCTVARPFWIGWDRGNITVGRGYVIGGEVFLFYEDPSPYLVTSVSLTSGYNGDGNGTYFVSHDEGKGFLFIDEILLLIL